MKISTDEGKTWVEVDSLRIIKDLDDPTDQEIDASLFFNFTHEGVVVDAWVNDVCEGTNAETYIELGDRLVNGI